MSDTSFENELPSAQPPDTGDVMSPEQLAEAKRYHRRQLFCDLSQRLIDLVLLACIAFLLARPLDDSLATFSWLDNRWWRLAAMFLAITGLHLAAAFPLAVYAGHVLEHQFALSRQSFAAWLWRYAKRHALGFIFGLALIQGLYLIIFFTGGYWWVAAAGAFFLVTVVLGQLAPVLILPLFYKIARLENDELAERFDELIAGTGLTIRGVYRMQLSDETVKANAMLAGLGRTRRVILGDTLLDGFSADEISVVFAHEVGHHVHRHIVKLMVAGLFFSAAGFFLCDYLLAIWLTPGDNGVPYATLPVYALPLIMFAVTLFSSVLEPLTNGMSRHFERQADRYALRATGLADAYRSAFARLARRNKADPDPHPLEVFLFYSHPPIAARLAMADGIAAAVDKKDSGSLRDS